MNPNPAADPTPVTDADPAPAIEASHLDCGYDGKVVLRDVSFSVRRGEIFYIIGGSGCGKTTLLRHLVGLMTPSGGDVRFGGVSFTRAGPSERLAMLRTFGMLFQSGALWSSLTLRQNVALPLEEYSGLSRSEIDHAATFKLAQVGLGGYEDYFPSEISGGMNKRGGLARALALDPQIVFFDEPSAGLDPVTARHMDNLILQVRDTFGMTILVVSHDLDSIFSIADRLIMLDRETQGIIANGVPRDLAAAPPSPKVAEFLSLHSSRPR
jgi:phospholipid/cholesterol/gamma-HCH transport system ATP-binding protein